MGVPESGSRKKPEKTVLDFSASVNPFPPFFEWNCDPEYLAFYPDDRYDELKRKIATTFHRRLLRRYASVMDPLN
jgi:threonine-phosphate decarboxylase